MIKRLVVVSIAVCALGSLVASAQIERAMKQATRAAWQQTSGPAGGAVFAIDSANGVSIVAGSAGATFGSTNGGVSWRHSHRGVSLTESFARLNAVGDGSWFAASFYHVWRSVDDGRTWAAAEDGLDAADAYIRVFDGTAYAVARDDEWNNALWVFDDVSETWSLIPTPDSIDSVLVEGQFILASNETAYSPTVMRSFDGGETWELIELVDEIFSFSEFVRSGSAIVAFMQSDGIWRSYDDGATWTQIVPASELSPVKLKKLGSALYVFEYNGDLYRSIDDGSTWTQINNGLTGIRDVALDGDRLLATATEVYVSDDDGQTWTQSHDGIVATNIKGLHHLADGVGAVESSLDGVYVSANGGRTWSFDPGALPADVNLLSVFEYDAQTLFIGTDADGVYRSLDGGATWSPANSGWPTYHSGTFAADYHRAVDFARIGDDIYAATGEAWEVIGGTLGQPQRTRSGAGVYRSSDLGQSWTPVRSGIPVDMTNPLYGNTIYASIVRMGAFDGDLLISTAEYGIYRSTDGAASWQSSSTGLPGGGTDVRVRRFLDLDGMILAASASYSLSDPFEPIFASLDGGQSWTEWATGLGTQRGVSAIVRQGNRLVASLTVNSSISDEPTFFVSRDDGASWSPMAGNVAGLYVNDLMVEGEDLLAATSLGVWRLAPAMRRVGEFGVVSSQLSVVGE